MRRFARHFLLAATLVTVTGLLLAPVPTPYASEGRPDIRDLHIVAHQDDDVLFMNPDIQRSIDAGHSVMTVYVTAGACASGDYYLGREAGVMAAYALMAGVDDNWTLLEDKPVRERLALLESRIFIWCFSDCRRAIPGELLPKTLARMLARASQT